MAYRSDRDGANLIGYVNFEFVVQMRSPSADSIRASRPDIRLHPYLAATAKKSLATPGGVHIRASLARDAADRQAAYRLLFRAAVSNDDLRAIRKCTHKGWALGSEHFKEEIERLTQRRTVSKGVGRLRKESPGA